MRETHKTYQMQQGSNCACVIDASRQYLFGSTNNHNEDKQQQQGHCGLSSRTFFLLD